ncbi:TonB-dependent siderophore receptor [Amniculibacterium sp. G2-70]|uniref:TonB-dependent siderophore receptor n=1 Tax=Amniculibacterium sp. G2-70 TaxID=2767188 RepID=UPI001654B3E4|nr:TonB-dependent receptor [Amniculibacterium sp. G2-70]
MKKQVLSILTIGFSLTAFAQGLKYEKDTIRIQEIEDVKLHKTGNPNHARISSTKSNLSVMETPQPIAIVTHEIIEQQQSKQLSDVLQNVNGIYVTSSRGNSQDSFGGRGFVFGNDNMFKNGTRINSGVFPEVSALERVEVLKGANAMLYGNTSAGGVINMITKKPRFNFGGSVGLSVGSWNTYKPTVDVYGPLTDKIAFRVNGSYEYAESFRDVVKSNKQYINPSFLFNISNKSQIIVEGDYLKHHFTPDFGIGGIMNPDKSYSMNYLLGRNAFIGTDGQYQDVQQATTNITWNYQLSKNWVLNTVASYQNYTRDFFGTERIVWETNPANQRLWYKRNLNRTYSEQNYESIQANLNGIFNTGKINHQLLLGADADYSASDSYTFYNPDNNKNFGSGYLYGTNGNANGILYLDDASTWAGGAMPNAEKAGKTRINTRRIGVYVQDLISLTKEFKVLAGLRWSYLENMPTLSTNFKTNTKTEVNGSNTSNIALSPKIGLIYNPNDNLSVFATYTNSFSPNSGYTSSLLEGLDTTGTAQQVSDRVLALPKESIRPTTIDQYELGVKKNFWNDGLAINATVYQIMYNNYYQTYWYQNATGVVVSPDSNLKEFAGKMRSRGVELDITGNPTRNISIIGGISYNNTVYVDTPEKGYVENQRLVRTPATTANASVFYSFDGTLKGLKTGIGAYFTGDRMAGWNDSKSQDISRAGVTRLMPLSDYTTFSFSLGYEWKKLTLQAKLNNIFDVVNYNVHENYSVNPIAPRNFYFTLSYKL